MNKEVKDKWVAALKSGKYKQGRGQLNGESGYCCLGVLCEVFIAEGGVLNVRRLPRVTEYDGETTYPPAAVLHWAGMESRFGESNCGSVSLWKLNDDPKAKRSFKRIADIIEKNWSIL